MGNVPPRSVEVIIENIPSRCAISAKLGTHVAICMCKNLMYVLYTFRREDGVGGREFG
jgi:hypothetical protein